MVLNDYQHHEGDLGNHERGHCSHVRLDPLVGGQRWMMTVAGPGGNIVLQLISLKQTFETQTIRFLKLAVGL